MTQMQQSGANAPTTPPPQSAPAPAPTNPAPAVPEKRPQRLHGLECPPDALQLVAIFVYALFIIGFITIYAVLFQQRAVQIALSVVMGALAIASIASYIIVARWVSDDPLIHDREEGERRCNEMRFCTICDCYVHPTTKHCMRCNKCVVGFDHHCRWLNNCIGSENYKGFASFLAFTWIVMAFNLAIGIYYIVQYAAYRDSFNAKLFEVYDTAEPRDQQAIFGVIVALVVLNVFAFGLLSHLVGIHILLTVDGVTTYQRILNLRAEAVEEQKTRDALGMPADGCWHASCHDLAVWCYTKGCEAPKPVKGVAPEGKYHEGGGSIEMTPEPRRIASNINTSVLNLSPTTKRLGGYDDEVNGDGAGRTNHAFSIEMTPTPHPLDDSTIDNNHSPPEGSPARPLDLGDIGGKLNTDHPAFSGANQS